MRNLFFILFFLLPLIGLSQSYTVKQQQEIDSLNLILKDSNLPDTTLINTHLNLCKLYTENFSDSLLKIHLLSSWNLIKEKDYEKQYAIFIYRYAKYNMENGDNEKAIKLLKYLSILSKKLNDSDLIQSSYHLQGLCYSRIGDYKNSNLFYLKELYHLQNNSKDINFDYSILYNVALNYTRQNNVEKALKYYNQIIKDSNKVACEILILAKSNYFSLSFNQSSKKEEIDEYFNHLFRLLNNCNDIKNKYVYNIYKTYAKLYNSKGDTTKALEIHKSSLNYFSRDSSILYIAWVNHDISFFYANVGNPHLANKYAFKALKYYLICDNTKGLGKIYHTIGWNFYQKNQLEKAYQYTSKGLEYKKKINDKYDLAWSYHNLGFFMQQGGDYKKAKDLYKKALVLREEIKDEKGIAHIYHNYGLFYSEVGKHKEAIKNFKIAIDKRTSIDDKYGLSFSYSSLANSYFYLRDTLNCIVYFKKCLNISKENNILSEVSRSNIGLGWVYLHKNELEKAKIYADRGFKYAQLINLNLSKQEANLLLCEINEAQGNNKNALSYYKNYIEIRDSINSKDNQKANAKLQAKYEYEKQKAIDDAEHEKEIAIEQEAKEKQTILTYATGGGLGLVGIFLLIVFNRLKVTRKQKNIIEEQKQEVEHQKEVVEQAHTQLEEKNKEITDSIQYAKRIQNAILPPNKVVKEYLQESFILYKPKDIVAGDFYWLEQKDNKVLFAAADCTGHGVPGAMVSVVCNNGLNRSVREYGLTEPGKILDKTREIVVEEFEKSEEEVKDGMDIALCSLEGTKLQYAGAHNPLWIIRKGELLETKANKQPIGKFDNPEPYTTHTIELQKGDSVYVFSDGYADQFGGEKGKKMKTANFKKLLLSIQKENMQKQKELIDDAFENWKGELEQLDDVCVIGVKV